MGNTRSIVSIVLSTRGSRHLCTVERGYMPHESMQVFVGLNVVWFRTFV